MVEWVLGAGRQREWSPVQLTLGSGSEMTAGGVKGWHGCERKVPKIHGPRPRCKVQISASQLRGVGWFVCFSWQLVLAVAFPPLDVW